MTNDPPATPTANPPTAPTPAAPPPGAALSSRQAATLCVSVFLIAACGIVYELSVATVSSYLLGNSVYQFSLTIGLFMAAMGVGSWVSRAIPTRLLLDAFVGSELALALVGGLSTALLFAAFPTGGFYRPAMIALIGVIGVVVGLEIPIIVRVLANSGGVRRGVADALSFDYVGALLGSLAFPVLMLPSLGLFRTAFAVGLMNAAVAALNLAVFRRHIHRPRALWAATLLVVATLAAGFLLHERISRHSEAALYSQRIIHSQQTPYQRVVLTRDDLNGEHRLYLDGHVQFAEFDEYRYHEALVHPLLAPFEVGGDRPIDLLILGGGDGLAAREALRFPHIRSVTVVDLDPAVTGLATRFPPLRRLNGDSLTDPRVSVLNDDAFNFVRSTPDTFGAVCIDLPDPHNEAIAKLYSVEFFRLVARCLTPGGRLSIQSGSPFFTPEVFRAIGRTLDAAGFDSTPYSVTIPAFGPWGFHLAVLPIEAESRGRGAPLAEASAAFTDPGGTKATPWPRLDPPARFMTPAVFAAATRLPPDTRVGADDAPVNSLFAPTLYRLYRAGVARGRPAPPHQRD